VRFKRFLPVLIVVFALSAAAFATAASASSGFKADKYPASLTGENSYFAWYTGEQTFCSNGGSFEASIEGPSRSVKTTSTEDCNSGGNNSVEMNGCNFILEPGPEESGTVSIGPPGCGPIHIQIYGPPCDTVKPQTLDPEALFINGIDETTGKDSVEIIAQGKLEYETCFGKTYSDLNVSADWQVSATNFGEPTGIRVSDGLSNAVGVHLPSEETEKAARPHIESDSQIVNIAGDGFDRFVTKPAIFECGETSLQGGATSESTSLELIAEYHKCTATLGEAKVNASVVMNGCSYTLNVDNAGPPYAGRWGVFCNEGEAIELKVFVAGKERKCAKITPQQNATELPLENVGEEPERGIVVGGEVDGLNYEINGGSCGATEARSDGILDAESTLLGSNEQEEGADLYVTGEEFFPSVEAEIYPTTVSGDGLDSFDTEAATFDCAPTSLEGELTGSASQLGLDAEYHECTATLLAQGNTKVSAPVSMNSCHYVLELDKPGPPPYGGSWGVTCEKAGDAIEFKVFILGKARRCAKIYSQQGLDGVDLETVGKANERAIAVGADIHGVAYTLEGSCGEGARTNGVISGEATLAGSG
jgi:hypothetical protein